MMMMMMKDDGSASQRAVCQTPSAEWLP